MEKIASALGLCRRAGKLVMGTELVLEAVRREKVVLVLMAEDTAENAAEKLSALCGHRSVPCRRIPLKKADLSKALGLQRETAAVAVPQEFLNLVLASL